MSEFDLTTPVLFLVFNRPDTTKQVFEAIRKAKPPRLYVAADGPRTDKYGEAEKCEEVRKIATNVDWDCEVKTLFREKNLGCRVAVSSAIDWFFENVEEGIILEDDCLPSLSFFWFCQELLQRYRNDDRIFHINGLNFYHNTEKEFSYFFSRHGHIWGWATWRRCWKYYDVDLNDWESALKNRINSMIVNVKERQVRNWQIQSIVDGTLNTWDYQWILYKHAYGGLNIIPSCNLVVNIGFSAEGTHTNSAITDDRADMDAHEIKFPLLHPRYVFSQVDFDCLIEKRITKNFFYRKTIRLIKRLIKCMI